MDFKNNASYLKSIKCADVYTESQADYVLPDYLGDVRKILFTEASLRPSGRFAGGEEVEFSGVVIYNVIYLDSEGEISSVEFTSDYDYSVKCDADSYSDSIADTRVSNYAVRLVGPRKISAKVSLVGSVRLTESSAISASGDAFDGESEPEINRDNVKVRQTKTSSSTEREYAESVARLEGAICDEVRVVYAAVEPVVDSVEATKDGASIKGRIRMWAIVKNADEPAYQVEKTVSFDETVDFEGITPDMSLIPALSVSSVRSNVNADEGGCEVVLSAIVEFCVIGEGNGEVDVILDGYLIDSPTENSYDEFCYTRLSSVFTSKISHTSEINRSELENEGLREIIFLTATPKIESVETSDSEYTVIGEIGFSGIASEMNGDKISYTGIKFSSPFSENIGIKNSAKMQIETSLRATNASATLDAEKLYASCSLEINVVATEQEKKTVLSSMSRIEEEESSSEGAKITVYYPSVDESLFSVAKRFRTSMTKVAKDNDITESVFSSDNPGGNLRGVKKLVIY